MKHIHQNPNGLAITREVIELSEQWSSLTHLQRLDRFHALKRAEAEERQARSNARKEHQKRVESLEAEILRMETRQKELTAALEDPATYSNGTAGKLNRELADVTGSLEQLNQQWASVTAAVATTVS